MATAADVISRLNAIYARLDALVVGGRLSRFQAHRLAGKRDALRISIDHLIEDGMAGTTAELSRAVASLDDLSARLWAASERIGRMEEIANVADRVLAAARLVMGTVLHGVLLSGPNGLQWYCHGGGCRQGRTVRSSMVGAGLSGTGQLGDVLPCEQGDCDTGIAAVAEMFRYYNAAPPAVQGKWKTQVNSIGSATVLLLKQMLKQPSESTATKIAVGTIGLSSLLLDPRSLSPTEQWAFWQKCCQIRDRGKDAETVTNQIATATGQGHEHPEETGDSLTRALKIVAGIVVGVGVIWGGVEVYKSLRSAQAEKRLPRPPPLTDYRRRPRRRAA